MDRQENKRRRVLQIWEWRRGLWDWEWRHRMAIAYVVCLVAYWLILRRRPQRRQVTYSISSLSLERRSVRDELMREIIENEKCRDIIRMGPGAFLDLCDMLRIEGGLQPTQRATIEEQVAKFLYILSHGVKHREISFFFRRSGETVNRHFHQVLRSVIQLEEKFLKQPDGSQTSIEILNSSRFFPYFKDCIGAIDGTHIRAKVPIEDAPRYRGRKDYPTQNVLAACTFDLKFTYVLPGWEGTASDSRILKNALSRRDKLKVPQGSNMSEKRTIDDVVKKDREYWTAVMDDALIDALLHQHHLGNRNGSVFTTHAYDNIVKELQEKFEKPIDKQKVKNRIKTIKYNWSDCYDVFKNGLSGFAWSPITKMWSAEPEVWESLIQAKPKAKELKNKPIPNYDKLVELYGKDRATGEQSETASEMRQRWATSTGEGSMENIEDVDHLVGQNEVTLESCDNVGDNNVGEASSKAKKRKTSKNEDMEQIMGAIQDVALAMREGNSALREGNLIFERSLARLPIPEKDVFHLLDEIGIDSRLRMRAYLFLIKNPDMLRAFIGYPVEERKELLFTMMSDP